ncbi:MAG: HepT-like ribonuclease domain-containing protein [Bryobacteraceae bacterium]
MPSKSPAQRLQDIVENIDAIRAFTEGMDLNSFSADKKTIYAVIRALEIISEASKRVRLDLKNRHPGLDWPAIAAAGNVYRHEYEVVDENLTWNTVSSGLQALRIAVTRELGP